MTSTRLQALGAPLGFVMLAATLVGIGALGIGEATWAVAAVVAGFVPSGWLAPARWPRRLVEAALLPLGYAITMVSDPTLRHMAVPALLALAAACAFWAGTRSSPARFHPLLAASLGIALWAAPGPPTVGAPADLLAGVALAALGFGATRLGGAVGGAVAVLVGCAASLPSHPALGAVVAIAGALAGWKGRSVATAARVARGWLPAAVATGCVASALTPWGALPLHDVFPAAGWWSAAVIAATALIVPFLPPAAAGTAWLAASLALGPAAPPPPEFRVVTLDPAHPSAELPVTAAGPYVLDLALAHAAQIPQGTPVAAASGGGGTLVLRAGINAAEWAWPRAVVRPSVLHTLPDRPVWRPSGSGRGASWSVAGRTVLTAPEGIRPRLTRDPSLPAGVDLVVLAAGPPQPTPPRHWALPAWLLAAAVAVALVQLGGGTWRFGAAAAPWAVLLAGSVAARMPVPTLRLLGERHAIDLALAAFLLAWTPTASAWLKAGRAFCAAATLLVPLALATPRLTPPLWGDEPYHLAMLDSMARRHGVSVGAFHASTRPGVPIHSPALAMLLLPAYLLDGRSGALVCLALGGAALVALTLRRARQLEIENRTAWILAMLLLLTHPLATFATQIWVEILGALLVAASLVLLARPGRGRVAVLGSAALAAAVKTRLALVTFPLLAVAWWPQRRGRRAWALAAAVLGGAVVGAIALSLVLYGHPLGLRNFGDLLPRTPRLAAMVAGGLLFDPAGGVLWAAPLLLGALAGTAALWRRGSAGERALMLGGLATVLALLHSPEWYGGGSPPGRYLVPLLPAFALAGAFALAAPRRSRRLLPVLLPPSVLTWWVLVTRPHLSINSGDGGWWFADALARRFAADARHLIPSFLRPCPATLWVPAGIAAVALLGTVAVRRHRSLPRRLARQTVAVWLAALAGIVGVLTQRHDRIVEVEDPQVRRLGGTIEPPEGTFSRWAYPNGWRIGNGEGVEIPVNLATSPTLHLEGWLDGAAREGATLAFAWDGSAPEERPVSGSRPGTVVVPAPDGAGRHWLRVTLACPQGGSAVLDRLVVER